MTVTSPLQVGKSVTSQLRFGYPSKVSEETKVGLKTSQTSVCEVKKEEKFTLAYKSSILCCGEVLLAFPLRIKGWNCFKPTNGMLMFGFGAWPAWSSKWLPLVSLERVTGLAACGNDLNLIASYLKSATTSRASLEGVDLTVTGVEREEPLLAVLEI